MKSQSSIRSQIPSQLALLLLASAVAIPAYAQAARTSQSPADSPSQAWQTGNSQNTPPSAAQQQSPSVTATSNTPPKEGFWGRVNPFARKKWVKKRTDAINDRLSELDDVNAKNANDIQDVDGRAQAGIHRLSPPPTQPTRPQQLPGSRLSRPEHTAQTAQPTMSIS